MRKRNPISRLCFWASACLIVLSTGIHSSEVNAEEKASKPNIVFVLADDLGWSELGCYGNRFNETPNLDRMAREGQRFTDAYAAAPVCSPYRAAFLTGLSPARLGILDYLRPNSANFLSTEVATLPMLLKQNGYATGMIGKWHLSGYQYHEAEYELRPTDYGFDWNVGSEIKSVGNGANTWPYVFRDQPIRWIDFKKNRLGENEYLTDRLNLEAVEFIERNKDRPFFLFLSHYAPHTILNGRRDLVAKYVKKHKPGKSTRANCYLCEDAGLGKGDPGHHWAGNHNPHLAAMLESIDVGVGKIRAKLESLGLLENTILIFSSDNGGESNVTSNAPWRGGKSELYEGGIRIPLIVSWPKGLPAGKLNRSPTINTDFLPTLLDASNSSSPSEIKLDGESTLDQWKNPESINESRTLYWHYPLDRPHFLGGTSSGAIRDGNWKLIEHFDTRKSELFSLSDDPSEKNDLLSSKPELVESLRRKLGEWRLAVGARVPSPPLLTQPQRLYFGDHFSGRASERLWYTGDWSAEKGLLQRIATGSENTRIFLRDAKYRNVTIRFDFQLKKSRDIRLVTGSNGDYNTVVHIRPDHFFIQTALDKSGPHFPCRHGECAFAFMPERWYTMTVEFIDDQVVAHVDREHLAFAKHPVVDKERTYLAFQVDDQPAAFDNIQILTATRNAKFETNLQHIGKFANRFPVRKTVEEEFKIRKSNAHERFYRNRADYRKLVQKIDELDTKKRMLFPAAFKTHKEFRKEIQSRRKKLLVDDSSYKELLFATYRVNREVEKFLIEQRPEIGSWPNSRKKSEIERLRLKYRDKAAFVELLKKQTAAQKKLELAYPDLFITDEEINRSKKNAYQQLTTNPRFRQLVEQRAAAWRAKEDFLFENDRKLAALNETIRENKN